MSNTCIHTLLRSSLLCYTIAPAYTCAPYWSHQEVNAQLVARARRAGGAERLADTSVQQASRTHMTTLVDINLGGAKAEGAETSGAS